MYVWCSDMISIVDENVQFDRMRVQFVFSSGEACWVCIHGVAISSGIVR